ncbi:SDR family NAD(P)-dependent oxidoreductase [Actinomadura sp. LD22]|uniref:SDR family NAD(P)-dependent oxidoreductase n=1 Tax=Actinomadura physcomitrii TaxID=2650748 RepID=A0A6I4MJY5_9ACTN|nr:oxidoreductase [Actinomadura physcomitrii]MWA04895.1 SDR family NAD(P)-dependent oxidoreductase [Actinomadura physcomitrii]
MTEKGAAGRWMITGVSGGLGRALAETVLDGGGTVVGTFRDKEQASAFEESAPGRSFAVLLDATDPADVLAERVGEAVRLAGHLDVLVNNAGYGLLGAVEEVSDEEARHQMDTNFSGPLRLIRAVLPHFRERGRGHIVNVSSIAGFTGQPGLGLYNASKFALEGLSEALRHELAPFGIRVTIVEPGAFRTRWAGAGLKRAARAIAEYEAVAAIAGGLERLDGAQQGDPRRAAQVIVQAVAADDPPVRLPLGRDAVKSVRGKLASVERELDAWEEAAHSTAFPSAGRPAGGEG